MTACAARPEQTCLDAETALAFADGQLAADVRADVESRIDACPRCRGIVAEAARGAYTPTVAAQPAGSREVAGRGPAGAELVIVSSHASVSELRSKRRGAGPSQSLETGERVGRYVVERAIGAGGMGVVSLARDPELKRAVVIKLVRADIWGDESRDELEARLRREAQAMAQLSHPNVVQIFDIGQHGERVFLAMEYVPGQTLDAWLVERARTPAEILAMLRQAGAGLDAAHRAGLVHRDFKPANVLVNTDGVAKVTDFGLARIPAGGPAITRKLTVPKPSGIHAALTAANAIVGTPAYMAPEQEQGQADARSDQYAFALVLLDALVGQSPVSRTVKPAAPDLEAALHAVPARARLAVARGLRDDPGQRFPTLADLLAELAPPVKRARRWPIVAGIGLCAVAVVVWLATRREAGAGPTCTPEAPRAWPAAARAQLVAAYTADPRPFGVWTGANLAAAIDRAVERLAADEIARCRIGGASAGSAPAGEGADCLTVRRAALAEAAKPVRVDDPWARVRAIDDCTPARPVPELARIRDELHGATLTGARAEELADRARLLHDDRLAADAYERAGLAALALADIATAERLLEAEAEVGERANDDGARGRARLYLLDVARWNGDLAAANREGNALRSILARQVDDAGAEVIASLHEAAAFEDVGDATRAQLAWERALRAATALGAVDDQLRARTGLAWARHADHFDLPAARTEIANALADLPTASGAAKAEALAVQADLAFAAGDADAAERARREAVRLDPARATALADRIRAARVRGLTDRDGAIAELEAIPVGDGVGDPARLRVQLARGQIQRAAGRAREAQQALNELSVGLRRTPLSRRERLEVLLERCAADADLGNFVTCDPSEVAGPLHPQAPVRVRVHQIRARAFRGGGRPALVAGELEAVLAIYTAVDAPAGRIAEVRWELARAPMLDHAHAVELANQAREAFAAAHRDAEVDDIDRWLAAPAADAGTADDAGDEPRDRRGPQP